MSTHNVTHYYVAKPDKSEMYGYDEHGGLRLLLGLPWLRPYLFCSQIEAQKIAKEYRCIVRHWPGKIYKNSPNNNKVRL